MLNMPLLGNIAGAYGPALIQGVGNWMANRNNRRSTEAINRQRIDLEREFHRKEMRFAKRAATIRAADLERAGLSKTLAAGSAAVTPSASAPPLETPKYGNPAGEAAAAALENAMALRSLEADVSKTRAETDRITVDTNLAKDTYRDKVLQESLQTALLADKGDLNALDKQLKTYGIKIEKYRAEAFQFLPAKYKTDLTKAQREVAEKNLLIEALEWDLAYAKDKGLPVKAQPSQLYRTVQELRALVNAYMEGGRPPRYDRENEIAAELKGKGFTTSERPPGDRPGVGYYRPKAEWQTRRY